MKKTLMLIVTFALALALALPTFAGTVFNYPPFLAGDAAMTIQGHTPDEFTTIKIGYGEPIIDGVLDQAYIDAASNGGEIIPAGSNWAQYFAGNLVHDPDMTASGYYLWSDGWFYSCIVIKDSDVTSIGLDAMEESVYPLPPRNPWMNDVCEQFFYSYDGSTGFKVSCDAYCLLPFFSDFRIYAAFIDNVNNNPDVIASMSQAAKDEGGWWAGDCVGGMWWVSGDLHPGWADQESVADYIDWVPGEETNTWVSGSTRYATSRESKFATTITRDGYIVESAVRMPDCKQGFKFAYCYQVVDIVGADDPKFVATTTSTGSSPMFEMVGGKSGGSDSQDETNPDGSGTTTPGGTTGGNTPTGGNQGSTTTDPVTGGNGGTGVTGGTGGTSDDNPKTGDSLILSIGALTLVAVGTAVCLTCRRKKND